MTAVRPVALWPHGDPRDVAQTILSNRRYQLEAPHPGAKPWWEVLWDTLGELWRRLTEPLNHLLGNTTFTTFVGIVVLVVVAALLIVVVVRFARRARIRRRATAGIGADPLGEHADAKQLFALALTAAAEGRHHDAAALLWASALRALDERGRVRYDAARTPGEWRRVVRDPSFDALARDAVVALFGDRGADAALVVRMREAYARVVAPA
jgi:hypothetical protein